MATLKLGSKGNDVLQWQLFVAEQGFDPGPLDSLYGGGSKRATTAFQMQHGLTVNGQADDETFAKAQQLGFGTQADPLRETGPDWPPKPTFSALTTTAQRQALFGVFQFEPAPVVDNPENIHILGDWVTQNIITVKIPQLDGLMGANRGRMEFHRSAANQLSALWTAWEQADLLSLVLSFDGSFVPRFQRDSNPPKLSNHAFGSAFDINAFMNPFRAIPALISQRGSVRELVSIANQHGFFWGGHFSTRPDGMHFEIARIL
jgi:hypothetical protein